MTLTVFDPRAGQRVAITVPAYRPTRLGSNILLALGTMTLAQVMAPTAAQAQCNSSSNPPPPSPVVANFLQSELRQPTIIVPYNVASLGLVGCNGPDGDDPVSPAFPAVRGSRAARSAARTAP